MGRPSSINPLDYTGKKFARMTVVEFTEKINGHIMYRCLCDCGTEKIVRLSSLMTGNTVSCGCYSKERRSAISIEANTKHNLSHHPLYHIWANMKDRCANANSTSYSNYGARGITVCSQWIESFENFYNWAISDGNYKDGLSIERVNVNGNYESSNCTFADTYVQSRNRRNSRIITIDGVTRNWIDWCRLYNIPESTVRNRVNRGMTMIEALTKGGCK